MFERLSELLRVHSGLAKIGAPQPIEAITSAENRLGVVFPEAFTEYLRMWGTLSFGPNEYSGLGTSISDVVWVTQQARDRGLDFHFLVICDHDGDEYDCLDTRKRPAGEAPIVRWDTATKSIVRRRSDDFETYLTDEVEGFL